LLLRVLLGLLLCPGTAPAQRGRSALRQEVEARFQNALERYREGSYAQARAGFQTLLDLSPRHQRSSAAALMLAKTLYRLREYPLAVAAVAQLYEGFPDSRYLPEGDLIVGDCRFRQEDTGGAVDQYVKVISGAGDVRLKARAADRLGEIVAIGRLSPAQTERLRRDLSPARFDEVVGFGQVRWAFRLGRGDLVDSRAAVFLKAFPDSPYAGEVRALMRTLPERSLTAVPLPRLAPSGGPARLKVGILCPVSRELGRELRDGALLARDLMPPATGDTLSVVFEDSQDDPVTSVKLAQK
jgi:hypothetical protein